MFPIDSPNLYYSTQKEWGFIEPTFFDTKVTVFDSDIDFMLWRYVTVETFKEINQ